MNKDDEDIAQAIAAKLGDTPGISYTEIASKAWDCGRPELAIRVGNMLSNMFTYSYFKKRFA